MNDDEIYRGIGEILVAIAPADAQEIILDAELSLENDHCKLLFDYIGENGEKKWFLPETARVDSDLFDLLVKMRVFFEANKLYMEGKPWTGCIVRLSLDAMKIEIDFKYD
ncbi:hypothetical protein AO073_27260 [Pseudomonas syringae ICMP 11293]|uniref:hypothetical protein n=1 Tax=Pseudomonas syringae TaxID=317 RepID=UPI00072FFD97|nr:hypothetical protein [Pseudomonas syringae]KTB89715.1 hypothetical protein AO073_27260 [Pseudomonas syringae ICMP 11293]